MDLITQARELVAYLSPLIVGGALARVGEGGVEGGAGLLGRAWGRLRGWLGSDPDALNDLERYAKQADNANRQGLLVAAIMVRLQQHPAWQQELAALVGEIQAQRPASSQTRSATVTNSSGVVITQGDVGGNLRIGPVSVIERPAAGSPPLAQNPAPSAASPPADPTLPATLSADGVHFSYGHALLIGVGDYQQGAADVPTTAADAEAVAALLQDPAVAAYPAAQVQRLSGATATRAGILAALDALAITLQGAPQPTVLLFFAGHGWSSSDTYFLLPHDYNPRDVAGSAIDGATFRTYIERVAAHAQKLLIVLNCCHAGGVGDQTLDAGGQPSPPPPADFYAPLAEGSGRVVITSARPAQLAGAGSRAYPGLTTFGGHFCAALRGLAPGGGAALSVFGLFSHLAAAVPADAQHISYRSAPLEQHPLFYARAVDQDFAVALRPRAERGGVLDASRDQRLQQLVTVELQLAAYADERAAPATLVAERDRLLQLLGT